MSLDGSIFFNEEPVLHEKIQCFEPAIFRRDTIQDQLNRAQIDRVQLSSIRCSQAVFDQLLSLIQIEIGT